MKTAILAVLAALATAAPARADSQMHDMHKSDVRAVDAWARATPGAARAGAAFLTLTNQGARTRRIVGAESDAAAKAELHIHIMDGTIMRMRKLDALDLPPGKSVTLKPGGHHVMLMGLRAPLKPGDRFGITLLLANGEKIPVSVAVMKLGAMGPGGQGHKEPHPQHGQ